MKKKKSPLSLVLYGVIALLVIYVAAALGTALDLSVTVNPETKKEKVDFSNVVANFESSIKQPKEVFSHLQDQKSKTFALAGFGALGVVLFILMKSTGKKRLHRKGVEHGSARWATETEEKQLADKANKKKAKEPKGKYETDNNIILTQEVKMSLNTRQHRENLNVLVIGGSGSGKSRFYVKPNLMQLNTSYVVTDPKGELLRSCGKLLKDAGYEIRVFNLIDMTHSNNYNPFNYIYDKDGKISSTYVMKMVNCLMKNTKQEGATGGDQFWDDSTKELLLAICFYLLERHQLEQDGEVFTDPEGALSQYQINFPTVMKVMGLAEISEQDENHTSPLDVMMSELSEKLPNSMAVKFYNDFKKAPAETAKSILISAAVRFAAFSLPEVADLMHTDNILLNTLGEQKTALFVIIPASDTTYNFLAAMMYTQMFDSLYDSANFKHGGRLPVHVRCMLDEFANVGTIPDFDKLLATMRSMEISANVIIQNLAQLKKMYDKSWEVITGNCDSQLFLGGKEASTLESISKQLGKETIDVVSHNQTKSRRSPSTSINNSIMGRELMTPDELARMPPDKCVLMIRQKNPFYCHKYNIETHKNYQYLEDSDKSQAYLIDDLHTLKISSDDKSLKAEKINPSEWQNARDNEQMISDIDIPDEDEPDLETAAAQEILGDDDYSNYYDDDTKEDTDMEEQDKTNTQKAFDLSDEFEDENELPEDVHLIDDSVPVVIDEDFFSSNEIF